MLVDVQHELALPDPPRTRLAALEVLDLFSGIGGLAAGFRAAGFDVHGVDNEEVAERIFSLDKIGSFTRADLSNTLVTRAVPVVVGGPPCRPWSNVNLQKRRTAHSDYALLERYFEHVKEIRPELFVMENVPALRSDDVYRRGVADLRAMGYSVDARILRYSDFGSSTARRRLFTIGVKSSHSGASTFIALLDQEHQPAATVRDAIFWVRDFESGQVTDHDWSDLESIGNYEERYRTGQYGWKQLVYDEPAPSFGSIAKTYILHPEAGIDGFPRRVLSVREAMSIMGFSRDFGFPVPTPRAKRYQMVANAVSPVVAAACGAVARRLLNAGGDTVDVGEKQNRTRVNNA